MNNRLTLITRYWNSNRIILAGDQQVNNRQGFAKQNEITCKILFIREINVGVGISGLLRDEGFELLSYCREVYDKKSPADIVEYVDAIVQEINENALEVYRNTSFTLQISGFNAGSVCNKGILKCPGRNMAIASDVIVYENQYNGGIMRRLNRANLLSFDIYEDYWVVSRMEPPFRLLDNLDFNTN